RDHVAGLELASTDTDPATDLHVDLLGTGRPEPRCALVASDASVDFGAVDVDTRSPARTIRLDNTGDADCHVGAIAQTGSGAFVLLFDPSHQSIAPGGTAPLAVEYDPVTSTGDRGHLAIPSDDPDVSSADVDLIGNGGGSATYPVASIDCPG